MMRLCNEPSVFPVSRGVSSTEFGDLETLCKSVVKEKQPFERLEISKETLLKMFKVREGERTLTSSKFYHVHALNLAINTGKMFNQVKNHNNQKCFCLSVQQIQVPYSE